MNRSPDWDSFRVFLGVVEHGSFSRAAGALGISQPTAGRVVAALEDALGTRLLVRRSRGVVPTPAGEAILEGARAMAQGAALALRPATGAASGLVRISATEGLGALWLPSRLAKLRREHPAIRVELVIDNLAVDLGARQADIAVRLFRPREPDLVARRLGTLGFGFWASPSYLALRGTPKRLADLARHDHIGFPETGFLPTYGRWIRTHVPKERFVVRTRNLLAQIESARAGLGITIATSALVHGEARLRRVLPRVKIPPLEIWLAVHADVRRNAAVAAVADALVEVFAEERASLAG